MNLARHSGFPSGALACFIASLVMTQMSSKAWSATQAEILRSCESCHGAHGDSQVASTPRLNGQRAGYIVDRLKKLSSATQKTRMPKSECSRSCRHKVMQLEFRSQGILPARRQLALSQASAQRRANASMKMESRRRTSLPVTNVTVRKAKAMTRHHGSRGSTQII